MKRGERSPFLVTTEDGWEKTSALSWNRSLNASQGKAERDMPIKATNKCSAPLRVETEGDMPLRAETEENMSLRAETEENAWKIEKVKKFFEKNSW